MLVLKTTTGFVTQVFDTETRKFTTQEFTAEDQVNYENEQGEPVASFPECLTFDMVQPPATPNQGKNTPENCEKLALEVFDSMDMGDLCKTMTEQIAHSYEEDEALFLTDCMAYGVELNKE